MSNLQVVKFVCKECTGVSLITFDYELFVEPSKCPYCGEENINILEID